MKTLFIPAKIKTKVNKKKIKSLSKELPKNIAIAYSIQYHDIAFEIKELLSNNITKITQVLGCSKLSFPKTTQAIVLIGSGRFHALSLASKINLPIYILEKDKLTKLPESEIESLKKTKKVSYLKFLNADKIGILISTKPGQENLKKAIDLSKKIKDKKSYLFISNNINTSEFENFGLESWVNTACPRLDFDSSVINIDNSNLRKSKNSL
ncbi:diphthamide synthesis protein [Candidatus Pacearchaeota archaeon]|nr:diphthamide synthesis protein [Candidatus Pacearchaeota archaeon]